MFLKTILFFFCVAYTLQDLAEITYSKPPCVDPFEKKFIPTSKCLPNRSIYQCNNNTATISQNCNDDCTSCTSVREIPLDICNTTTQVSSYSCKNLNLISVGDVGFIYEKYSNGDCIGSPLLKGYQFGGLCFSKKKFVCQDKYVKEYDYKTDDCREEDPASSIKFTIGVCAKDTDGNFIKILRCGPEPWFPLWAIITTSVGGASILACFVFIVFSIWLFCNCRKGGYYNPIIEGEDEIQVVKGIKYDEI